jgi:hypothetical protein
MKPLRPLLKHYRILIACSTAPLHTIPVNDPIVTNLPNSNTSGNSGGGSGGSLGNQPKIDALIAMITSWIAEMKKPPTPTPTPSPLPVVSPVYGQLGAYAYLHIGSSGSQVASLQSFLIQRGGSIPALSQGAAYEYFGMQTMFALSQVKTLHGCN